MNFNEIKLRPVVCRQSTIGDAKSCRRKWFLKYRMGVVLRGGEYKESADLGKIYHRLHHLGPGSEAQVKAEIQQQQIDLMARVDKGEDLDGNLSRTASMLTELYNKAVVMARIFWEKYSQPSHFKTIGTEIKHTMQYDGLTLSGTIDKLLFNEKDNTIWIRDHKTTGRSLEAVFGGIVWSLQARLYRILAEDFIKNNRIETEQWIIYPMSVYSAVRGFILDGILKPGIKLCNTDRKNAEKWECSEEDAYLHRVKEWYKDYEEKQFAETGTKNAAIRSKAILFTEPLVTTELDEAFELMKDLSITGGHPNLYSRDVTRKECFAYQKQCPYHDLCETDPNLWDSLFETKYKIEPAEEQEND